MLQTMSASKKVYAGEGMYFNAAKENFGFPVAFLD